MECKRWREKRAKRRQRDEEKKSEEENEMSRGGGAQLDVVAARSGIRFAFIRLGLPQAAWSKCPVAVVEYMTHK